MVDPFAIVGAQEQGYARMRQQESQFSRGQIMQASGMLQQQGQFDQRQQLAETQQKMQLVDQEQRIKQGMLENVRQERAMRMAEQRMEAMTKLNGIKAQTAQTNAQVAMANLEIAKARKAQEALGGHKAEPAGFGEKVEFGGVPHEFVPKGGGAIGGDWRALTGKPLADYQAGQTLKRQTAEAELKAKQGKGDVTPSQMIQLMNFLGKQSSNFLAGEDVRTQAAEQLKQVQAKFQEMTGLSAGAQGQASGEGAVTGAVREIRDMIQTTASLVGSTVEGLQSQMGPWLEDQMRKNPGVDPMEFIDHWLTNVTENARREKVR